MQINRDNYSYYSNLVQQMAGNKKNQVMRWRNAIMVILPCVLSRLILVLQNQTGIIL